MKEKLNEVEKKLSGSKMELALINWVKGIINANRINENKDKIEEKICALETMKENAIIRIWEMKN